MKPRVLHVWKIKNNICSYIFVDAFEENNIWSKDNYITKHALISGDWQSISETELFKQFPNVQNAKETH